MAEWKVLVKAGWDCDEGQVSTSDPMENKADVPLT